MESSLCCPGLDLGVAFRDVPRGARPFLRFPTGRVHHAPHAAVLDVLGDQGLVCLSTRAPRPPHPLNDRVVVQVLGPQLDGWVSLKLDPRQATVRFLKKLCCRVLAARLGRAVTEADVFLHFGSVLPARTRAAASARGHFAHGHDTYVDAELEADQPLSQFNLAHHDNGVQSRPVYMSVSSQIS